jgi:ABC-type branched-subunit amino acid transport system ATPase component
VDGDSAAPALETRRVSVSFGGPLVVNGVDLRVDRGEVVGLIGSNGAGKSTLMNAIGGYLRSSGQVLMHGRDISGWAPAERSRAGLGRAFQSAGLFPELSVLETVQVALERRMRTSWVVTLTGWPSGRRHEQRLDRTAAELIDLVGLGRYAHHRVSELSTGTRRIVELACLIAHGGSVICLDEPTAGVAQAETEAFGPLLLDVRRQLDATMIIIEHDMPLIMSVSDRVYCMEAGVMIAEGDPESVRNDAQVIASYLGTDERAIERSGPTT